MSPREMQAAIEALIKAQAEMTAVIESQGRQITALMEGMNADTHWADGLTKKFDQSVGTMNEMLRTNVENLSAKQAEVMEFKSSFEEIRTMVESRNKSAALKRNMTDEDALRVLTGDLKDPDHKSAAAQIGLTYAQIYSCRMEFTFKHVHKDLRENGWKNPWVKNS